MSSSSAGRRIVVVGAGIAGLSAAFRLRQAGMDVTVLEKADRVGGRMLTVERDGYRIDAAASVLPTTYRQTQRLVADAGLGGETASTSDLLGIARPERVHHLRSGRRTDLLRTRLLGTRSKLRLGRVLLDMYRHRTALNAPASRAIEALDAETIADYARRLLTDEAFEYFVQPLTGDFYLTPADELSVVNLFLLLDTMIGAAFINSAKGIRFLPDGLARQLPVELTADVSSVIESPRGVKVAWTRSDGSERVAAAGGPGQFSEDADAAVVAVPAPHAAAILPTFDADLRAYLEHVPYARSLVVTLTLDAPPAQRAMWLTVPDRTDPDVNVVILDHNKAPGRVPAGAAMISVYWHRDWAGRYWDRDDDKIVPDAVTAIARVLPDVVGHVVNGYVWRWDPCTVARPAGGFAGLAGFASRLDPSARIQLAGDYFAITTVENSLASGAAAASRLIRLLS